MMISSTSKFYFYLQNCSRFSAFDVFTDRLSLWCVGGYHNGRATESLTGTTTEMTAIGVHAQWNDLVPTFMNFPFSCTLRRSVSCACRATLDFTSGGRNQYSFDAEILFLETCNKIKHQQGFLHRIIHQRCKHTQL